MKKIFIVWLSVLFSVSASIVAMEEGKLDCSEKQVVIQQLQDDEILVPQITAHEICALCEERLEGKKLSELDACQHTFHEACLERSIEQSNTCPTCNDGKVVYTCGLCGAPAYVFREGGAYIWISSLCDYCEPYNRY